MVKQVIDSVQPPDYPLYVLIFLLVSLIFVFIGFLIYRSQTKVVVKDVKVVEKVEKVEKDEKDEKDVDKDDSHVTYVNNYYVKKNPWWQPYRNDTINCLKANRTINEGDYVNKQEASPTDDVYGTCERASPQCRLSAKCTDNASIVSGCSVKVGSYGEYGCPTQCCSSQLSWNFWGRNNS